MTRSQLERQSVPHQSVQAQPPERRKTKDDVASDWLVTISNPSGAAAEAYYTLRTGILNAQVGTPPKVIMVTSPDSSTEGKSYVCANLGVALAQTGKSVLVVDCDLREPAMHEIFGLRRNVPGVVDVLVGDHSLQEAFQEPLSDLDLKVLSVGTVAPNPAKLLGSGNLSQLLGGLRESFDYVLIDSSPVGLVSDPVILATQADAVLLTLDAQRTRKRNVRQTMRSLTAVGANVLGTVTTNVK